MTTPNNPPREIPLSPGHEHIELCDLLKHAGLSESGGAAKHLIAAGSVTVDGAVELRKRCKIRPGQVVETAGQRVVVTAPSAR
jgi:ribosome-associated protein